MKDEIKEIIDSLKFVIDNPTLEDEVGDKQVAIINYTELNAEESKQLLDYITNLQKENKELLEKFSNKIEEVSNLIKENEKLKLAKDTKCASEILCECLHNDYKSRCEKAIEYIEERKNLNWYADGVFVYELLNILQGEDKDD